MDYKSARRVMVYRIGSLGDTIVALPSMHLIARVFPSAVRVMLTNFPVNSKAPAASAILGDSGLIHDYMRYSVGTRNPFKLLNLWWKIIRFRPDVLVYLMPMRGIQAAERDARFFRLAGVRHIVGLPGEGETFRILDQKTGLFQREATRLAQSVSALGDAKAEALQSWDLRLTNAEKQTASRALSILKDQPLIVCAPGTKWQSKDWGTDNWYALLKKLSAELPGHGLIFVGVKEDSDMAEKLIDAWSGKSINLCGQLAPRESAAVMAYADLFLGPDSGPMHLAALMGVACVIAFSAQGKPGVWFPTGEGHRVLYRKIDCAGCELMECVERKKECMRLISVEEMLEAALSSLRSPLQGRL